MYVGRNDHCKYSSSFSFDLSHRKDSYRVRLDENGASYVVTISEVHGGNAVEHNIIQNAMIWMEPEFLISCGCEGREQNKAISAVSDSVFLSMALLEGCAKLFARKCRAASLR